MLKFTNFRLKNMVSEYYLTYVRNKQKEKAKTKKDNFQLLIRLHKSYGVDGMG